MGADVEVGAPEVVVEELAVDVGPPTLVVAAPAAVVAAPAAVVATPAAVVAAPEVVAGAAVVGSEAGATQSGVTSEQEYSQVKKRPLTVHLESDPHSVSEIRRSKQDHPSF